MTIVNRNKKLTKCYYGVKNTQRKNKCEKIDAAITIQYTNLINSLDRLIIEESKKIAHLEKRGMVIKISNCPLPLNYINWHPRQKAST